MVKKKDNDEPLATAVIPLCVQGEKIIEAL